MKGSRFKVQGSQSPVPGPRFSGPRSPVPDSPVFLRPMTEGDLDQVVAIEQRSFPLPWTREQFLDELRSSHSFPLVAVAYDGVVAGYLCPSQVLDEGEILDVAVAEEFQGQGVGRLLVESALASFRERGVLRIFLEVRVSNQPAISLYQNLGFQKAGYRKRYYENGEDALLMDFSINGVEHAI